MLHQSEMSLQNFRLLVPHSEKNHKGDHIKLKTESGTHKANPEKANSWQTA